MKYLLKISQLLLCRKIEILKMWGFPCEVFIIPKKKKKRHPLEILDSFLWTPVVFILPASLLLQNCPFPILIIMLKLSPLESTESSFYQKQSGRHVLSTKIVLMSWSTLAWEVIEACVKNVFKLLPLRSLEDPLILFFWGT